MQLNKFEMYEIKNAARLLAGVYTELAVSLADLLECEVQVASKHADCPSTLKGMRKCVQVDKVLPVSAEGCSDTLYGTLGNISFRAMHDLAHVLYGRTVSAKDEKALSVTVWQLLVRPLLKQRCSGRVLDVCKAFYFTDTMGQTLVYEQFGMFVGNQVEFLSGMLVDQYFMSMEFVMPDYSELYAAVEKY